MGTVTRHKLEEFWEDFCDYSNTNELYCHPNVYFPKVIIDISSLGFISIILSRLTNCDVYLNLSGKLIYIEESYKLRTFASWESYLT